MNIFWNDDIGPAPYINLFLKVQFLKGKTQITSCKSRQNLPSLVLFYAVKDV